MEKMREVLDILVTKIMHEEEGQMLDVKYSEDYPEDFNQALAQIKSELLEKLPKEIDTIGKIDEWGTGFNSCLSQVKQVIEEALK